MSAFEGWDFDDQGWATSTQEMPEAMGDRVLRVLVASNSEPVVKCVSYGPRGGERIEFAGTYSDLEAMRRRLTAALEFHAQVRPHYLAWMQENRGLDA